MKNYRVYIIVRGLPQLAGTRKGPRAAGQLAGQLRRQGHTVQISE